MERWRISLACRRDGVVVSPQVSVEQPSNAENSICADSDTSDIRSSDIFLLPFSPRSWSKESYRVIFYFTLEASRAIHAISQKHDRGELEQVSFFTTHGFASIVAITSESSFDQDCLVDYIPEIRAVEVWSVVGGQLNDSTFEIKHTDPISLGQELSIDLSQHSLEEQDLFEEALISLRSVKVKCSTFFPEFAPVIQAADRGIKLNSFIILFARGKISLSDLQSLIESSLNNDISNSINALIDEIDTLTLLHQSRDAVMQMSAILQSISRQAFAGTPPLTSGYGLSGRYSLLGFSLAYLAILRLYEFVRHGFASNPIEPMLKSGGLEEPSFNVCPPNCSDRNPWVASFRSAHYRSPQSTATSEAFYHHLLYFSNRLGYKETDLAVTAAYQAISLGWDPSWHLSTLFHEFLHSHVKAILAVAYPLKRERVERAREAMMLNQSNVPLEVLIDSIFIRASIELSQEPEKTVINRELPAPDDLIHCLHSHNDLIDEIIVHILDFNYFYDLNDKLYIRSIWESWTTLPFLVERVEEYALRTLSAIASKPSQTGSSASFQPTETFGLHYGELLATLAGMADTEKENASTAKRAWELLKDNEQKERLRRAFYIVIPIIELVKKVFLSQGIRYHFHQDSSTEYDITEPILKTLVFEYSDERLDSPIPFLLGTVKTALEEQQKPNEIPARSLWIIHNLSSIPERHLQ